MAEIAIRNLVKRHGKIETIHGIDLAIDSREFVVILGPSGSGKSTLLRMIAGLEEITAGEIAIDGKVVNLSEPKARGCAMVFQNYALYPHMTVADNIGYALKVAGVGKAERRARIAAVAETLELTGFLDRRPAQLSGGQRQRVAMGRAMIREPKIFLFDEPLSNLDAKLRVQMRLEIRRLHKRLGTTSIFVTHDQVEAMTLADKLVVMNHGRIEQVDTPAEVYRRPANLFVAGFIGSAPMNIFAGRLQGGSVVLDHGARFDCAVAGQDGARVQVGVRPEDLIWQAVASAATLPFDVELVEELGSGKLVYGDIDGQPATVALTGTAPVAGTRVNVGPGASVLHLFDMQSGQRLNGGELETVVKGISGDHLPR